MTYVFNFINYYKFIHTTWLIHLLIFSIIEYNITSSAVCRKIDNKHNDWLTTLRPKAGEPKLYNWHNQTEYSSLNSKTEIDIRYDWEFRAAHY